MARIIRNVNEDLEPILKKIKIGQTVFDSESGYDITKVEGGYIYKHEYVGMVFVPSLEKKKPVSEK